MDLHPVFVDGSGWRRLTLRWSGIAIAGALAAYLMVVGNALISHVDVPPAKLPRKATVHPPGHADARGRTHRPQLRPAAPR